MEDIRIVIVDDSAFSVAFIRNILETNGFEVVGDAGSLQEVKQVVKDTKPTLVTMDMTLPGTDGLECTRAIHEIDDSVKVIVISSMMDEEIVRNAKKNKVSAYIQKPFDADELVMVINRLMATEELYQCLQESYFEVFKESLMDGLNKMTKTLLTYTDEYLSPKEQVSAGISVLVGVAGKFSGRMLIDLSRETANNIALSVFRKESISNSEMTAAVGEFANIIAGNACSVLNRKNKALGLRVAPPSILTGENVQISAPNVNTKTAIGESNFGTMLLNVGFTKGEAEWT